MIIKRSQKPQVRYVYRKGPNGEKYTEVQVLKGNDWVGVRKLTAENSALENDAQNFTKGVMEAYHKKSNDGTAEIWSKSTSKESVYNE